MPSKTNRRATPPSIPATAAAPHPLLAALGRSRWLYAVLSVALLLPCYWQPRVQAGDLSSHIYNSWLAQLVENGHMQGLAVVTQTTNVLFDLILAGLFKIMGAEAAQRIAVSLAVLIFIWGAFAFAASVSGRKPWQILPCIAMLAYGWVFHMGFFNFYLSLGLGFWALALLWVPSVRRVIAAVMILLVACVAHALPVLWAGGLAAYLLVGRRMSAKLRVYAIAGSLAAMLILHLAIGSRMLTRWSPQQVVLMSGLDQTWVFDGKYYLVLLGLMLIWGSMFLNLIHGKGREVASSMPFQLCLISAAAVAILPTSVLIPGYKHVLAYIAERMSLGVGICVCAMLASVRMRRFEQYGLVVVTLLFFGFLYRDERALNSFEDRMEGAVAVIPEGQRVVSALDDPTMRINALTHMIDRVCVGRCYSYANYEPSTAQFRVRATAQNPYVAYTYEDSWMLQVGMYVPKPADLPLYQVDYDARGQMIVKSLPAGAPIGSTQVKAL